MNTCGAVVSRATSKPTTLSLRKKEYIEPSPKCVNAYYSSLYVLSALDKNIIDIFQFDSACQRQSLFTLTAYDIRHKIQLVPTTIARIPNRRKNNCRNQSDCTWSNRGVIYSWHGVVLCCECVADNILRASKSHRKAPIKNQCVTVDKASLQT